MSCGVASERDGTPGGRQYRRYDPLVTQEAERAKSALGSWKLEKHLGISYQQIHGRISSETAGQTYQRRLCRVRLIAYAPTIKVRQLAPQLLKKFEYRVVS
nr:hypothetical protein CFP56_63063 [Quercus suber]